MTFAEERRLGNLKMILAIEIMLVAGWYTFQHKTAEEQRFMDDCLTERKYYECYALYH